MTKILIAPNSFKECAGSIEITEQLKGYFAGRPDGFDIVSKPLSDGGDGFLDVCNYYFGCKEITYHIKSMINDELIECTVGYSEKFKTVYIESADVIGLKLLSPEYRKPHLISSKAMGELLILIENDILANKINAEKVLIGIGGTGTNDMGLGMLSALGFELFDEEENLLEVIPANYAFANSYKWSIRKFPFETVLVVDVDNPLTGANGASYVFARQKGAYPEEIELMEKGFINIIELVKRQHPEFEQAKLSGAGGGIVTAFQLFLNSNIIYAKEFILEMLGVAKADDAGIVITGEGAFDAQSLGNKGPGIIIDFFESKAEKIFLIVGKLESGLPESLLEKLEIIELSSFCSSKEESIKNFKSGLNLASGKIYSRIPKR